MARKTRGGKVSNDQLSLFESFEWFTEIDISNVEGEKSEGILPIEERPDASFDSHGTGTNSTDGREQISEILHGNEPTTSESFGPSEPNGFDELQQLGDATDERPSESVAEQLDDHESDEPLTNYHIVLTDERLNNDQKFENNIHAIETLVNTAGRKHLTDEEKNTLAHYTGWGGLPHVFDEYNFEWSERRNKLKYLLTEEQYDSARASTLDSFYTPYIVIEKMYEMVQKLGFEHGLILDPSMGNGNYFGMMPRDMMERSLCVGCELDEITGKIAQKLYPKEDIHICGFQNLDIQNKTVDMAISNIPFGSYKVNDKEYNSFNFDIHNYFSQSQSIR